MTVSIVIPVYNDERRLGRSIESALNQTHSDCEVIVVDDGSSDGSAELARSFQPRVTVISQENRGLAGARNTGIKHASGECFVFLDSDDWLEPEAVATMLRELERLPPEFGVVGSRSNKISHDGEIVNSPYTLSLTEESVEVEWRDLVSSSRRTWFPCSALVRKEVFDRCGVFDEAYHKLGCEDRDMWIRASVAFRIQRAPERLLNIQMHDSNMSGDPRRQIPGMLRCLQKAKEMNDAPIRSRLFWRHVFATFHLQASTMWQDFGRPAHALGHIAQSLVLWPIPGISARYGMPRFSRLKRLAACFRGLLSVRPAQSH